MERERTGVGYTVHELAELSGCTVRTLHHYDDLGLVPAQRANNGYRRYGAAEVDPAHQVLLYRECGSRLLHRAFAGRPRVRCARRAGRPPAASCMRASGDWTD